MIRVVFLAQLREQLASGGLEVDEQLAGSISELKAYLAQLHPEWCSFLENTQLLVALNHAYVRTDAPLNAGDEVAFFPPVTGG